MVDFDSVNPYESLAVIMEDSPQALVDKLKSIKTPIKIVSIVQVGTRSAAYIMGDIRLQPALKKIKGK